MAARQGFGRREAEDRVGAEEAEEVFVPLGSEAAEEGEAEADGVGVLPAHGVPAAEAMEPVAWGGQVPQ